MQEITQTTDASNTPTAFGYCAWHKGYADGVRLIHAVEQGSGGGHCIFACPPCREVHRLTPLADQP